MQVASPRSKRPVFVLGSPRSGTTLLYHMLLSAGDFAVYRTESNVFNLLVPRFRELSVFKNRRELMKVWLGSKLYARSGLDAKSIESQILENCRSGGDFLRIVMGEIAGQQNVGRWADCTPDHLLYLRQIKKELPDALIIHILRDGRDVALSLDKQRWIRPFPWDKDKSLLVAGIYWEWMVNQGRENARAFGRDYLEVRFEDLVSETQSTLDKVGEFIAQDLDYGRIRQVGIGSVSSPNTSFQANGDFQPAGRWHSQFPASQLQDFESLVGRTIQELGYALSKDRISQPRHSLKVMRGSYRSLYDTKLFLKSKTNLGRFLISDDLSWL